MTAVRSRAGMADYPFSIRLRVMLIVALSVAVIITSGFVMTRYFM